MSSTLLSTQRNFDAYKVSCKAKFLKIDENEISILKTKINNLGNILKKYEFNKAKLEDMFSKKNSSKKHIHTTHAHTHTHTKYDHTPHVHHAHKPHVHHAHHAFKYERFYKCTYYGRNGHLAKFYYDCIIGTNNHVCVRSTNVVGPKKLWVSKSTTSFFDIGTQQGSKT